MKLDLNANITRVIILSFILTRLVMEDLRAERVFTPPPLSDEQRGSIRRVGIRISETPPVLDLRFRPMGNEASTLRRRQARERAGSIPIGPQETGKRMDFPQAILAIPALPFMGIAYASGLAQEPSQADLEEARQRVEAQREVVARGLEVTQLNGRFAHHFLQEAQKRAGRRLRIFLVEANPGESPPNVVVENAVETVCLDPHGPNDGLRLTITVRTRITLPASSRIIYDGISKYESGEAELSAWVFNNNEPLKNQFDRACREIGARLVSQILPQGVPNHEPLPPKGMAGITLVRTEPLGLINVGQLGRVAVTSTCSVRNILVQRPLPKNKALKTIQTELQADLDSVADLPVTGTIITSLAIPFSLAKQAEIAARGIPDKRFKIADRSLAATIQELKVQPLLRGAVLNQATNLTSYPISEVPKAFPKGQEEEFKQMGCVMSGTLAWVPQGQSVQYYLESHGFQTILEVEIIKPALRGEGRVNPSLSFSAGVRATLWSVRTGEEMAFCEMNYRSAAHKFTDWAEDDGALLRKEIAKFTHEVSATIVQQMGIPAWRNEPRSILATHEIK